MSRVFSLCAFQVVVVLVELGECPGQCLVAKEAKAVICLCPQVVCANMADVDTFHVFQMVLHLGGSKVFRV